ncbi:hypothetical protein C8Q76DRAFT_203607 [Earliella scabrosa]|nr:hypothetical protein C8Q76DRAFT_203607 [Earliella scabrosa]
MSRNATEPPCQAEGESHQEGTRAIIPSRLIPPSNAASTGPLTACTLQSCLNKHTYNPEKCDEHLRKLYKCCWNMYRETDGKGESTACPMESVVRRWLKNHGERVS